MYGQRDGVSVLTELKTWQTRLMIKPANMTVDWKHDGEGQEGGSWPLRRVRAIIQV